MLRSISLILLVISASPATAQTDTRVPNEITQTWSYLIGRWDIDGHVGSAEVTGSATFEWAAGGACYLGKQTWRVGPKRRTVHLALLAGWDPAANETVEHGFSSGGETATVRYRTSAEGEQVTTGHIDGIDGAGARWTGSVQLERIGKDEIQFTSTVDGEVLHALQYTRDKSSSATNLP
jgi:hypothetical protein